MKVIAALHFKNVGTEAAKSVIFSLKLLQMLLHCDYFLPFVASKYETTPDNAPFGIKYVFIGLANHWPLNI